MMTQLPTIQRKSLAVFLLLVFVVLLVSLIFRPLWNRYVAGQTQIEQMRSHIAALESVQLRAEDNRILLQTWQRSASPGQYLLPGASPDLAAARLQKKIKSVIVNAGGQLISTRKLAHEAGQLLQSVGIRVKMRADIDAIKKILHAFESHVPLLKVDEVTMIQRGKDNTRQQRGNDEDASRVIEMRFDISGYIEPVRRQ